MWINDFKYILINRLNEFSDVYALSKSGVLYYNRYLVGRQIRVEELKDTGLVPILDFSISINGGNASFYKVRGEDLELMQSVSGFTDFQFPVQCEYARLG